MSQKQIHFNYDQLNLKLSFFYVQDANRGMRTPEKGGRLPTNISPITKTGQVKVTAINILFICWIEALDWSDGFLSFEELSSLTSGFSALSSGGPKTVQR